MLVKNENFQEFELSQIVNDILNDYTNTTNISVGEDDAQSALVQMMYESNLHGNRHYLKNKAYKMPIAELAFLNAEVKDGIWKKLQEMICDKFDEETEQDKIAETVANAIAELLPYKIITKPLLKIILFYILKYGHTVVCEI